MDGKALTQRIHQGFCMIPRRLLALVTVVAVIAPTIPFAEEVPHITVTGEAEVQVTPDRVTVMFGIETWDDEMETARKNHGDILKRAKAAIAGTGVPEKDIRTDHLSIEPRYTNGYEKKNFVGYFVRNSVSVILNEPDKLETLIAGILKAGVTHIHGISFETTKLKSHRMEARRLAMAAALEKAEVMTAVVGKTVGEPIRISENTPYRPWHYAGGWWGHGRASAMSQNVVQNISGQGDGASDTVALGKISVTAGVTVAFTLK